MSIQPLDALAVYPLAGTEGAIAPFWSADSRFVGFVAEQKLKKIEASGGVPFSICDVGPFRGGAWNGDDLIVFATSTGGLQKVSAAGGAPAAATVVQAGEIYHTRPLSPAFQPAVSLSCHARRGNVCWFPGFGRADPRAEGLGFDEYCAQQKSPAVSSRDDVDGAAVR